jgi:hypothetical protein
MFSGTVLEWTRTCGRRDEQIMIEHHTHIEESSPMFHPPGALLRTLRNQKWLLAAGEPGPAQPVAFVTHAGHWGSRVGKMGAQITFNTIIGHGFKAKRQLKLSRRQKDSNPNGFRSDEWVELLSAVVLRTRAVEGAGIGN